MLSAGVFASCLEVAMRENLLRKKTCNATMLTRVTLQNGKTCFYPIKYYCANSIIEELEKFLLRNNFALNCELWRKREVAEGLIADVYDGNLWKEFQTVNGTSFLEKPRNYGFMLNFDFFQPMKHRKDYSVGVLLGNFKFTQS